MINRFWCFVLKIGLNCCEKKSLLVIGKNLCKFEAEGEEFVKFLRLLKTSAFIEGKSENQAAKHFFIHFSIDNLIANISLYALSWPKLNFGSFEIIFKL